MSTSGKTEKAEVPFKQIPQEGLGDSIQSNPDFDFENENIKIKISRDDARMTRNTSFKTLSFALLKKKILI